MHREKQLEENIEKLEKSQRELRSTCHHLETSIQSLNEEKLALNLEVSEQKSKVEMTKDMLETSETRLRQVSVEKSNLNQQLNEREDIIEKFEMDLRKAVMAKDELENQFTSITLQKDALEDEINHKRIGKVRYELDIT